MQRTIVLALVAATLASAAPVAAAEEEVASDDAAAVPPDRGCRTVDVVRVGRTPSGGIAYRFHHVKRWCWSFPHVTSAASWTYVSDLAAGYDYKGVVSASGGYFAWCCGVITSGHSSIRQGRVDLCGSASCRHEYPWVRIAVRADGTYAYRTGLEVATTS